MYSYDFIFAIILFFFTIILTGIINKDYIIIMLPALMRGITLSGICLYVCVCLSCSKTFGSHTLVVVNLTIRATADNIFLEHSSFHVCDLTLDVKINSIIITKCKRILCSFRLYLFFPVMNYQMYEKSLLRLKSFTLIF